MKYLVTGGAGFIGSHFIEYLFRQDPHPQVVCVDCLTYAGNTASLDAVWDRPDFRFYRTDICCRPALYDVWDRERPDVVVNFAAESHVDRSIEEPETFLRTNVTGVSVLLDACLRYGVKRFHQVSTDEVYGDLPLDRTAPPFTEESPLHPSSPYSASKASADLLAAAYGRTYGVDITISRSSNNYGPRQFPEKLLPVAILRALENREIPLYGDGRNVRDWLHVEDHCRAIGRIIRQGQSGRIYHVGGHAEMENRQLVRQVCRIMGKPESLVVPVPDRRGHDRRYSLNTDRLEKELGWRPEKEFSRGLEETVAWYLENRKWWQDILSGRYRRENEEKLR